MKLFKNLWGKNKIVDSFNLTYMLKKYNRKKKIVCHNRNKEKISMTNNLLNSLGSSNSMLLFDSLNQLM